MENLDWGKTSADYARHRQGFPDSFFDRLFDDAIVSTSDILLDLGTGTGALARGFAARECQVTGSDISPGQLAAAADLAAAEQLKVEFLEAPAESTGLSAESFDVVTAGQCWHWFDRPVAAQEVWRLLKAGGHLVIAHFDWLPLPGNVVEATETLIKAHNPKWPLGGSDGRHADWCPDIEATGFRDLKIIDDEVIVPYAHDAWCGRIRASGGIGGTLEPDEVAKFDAEHRRLLADQFPDDPLAVPHRVWALTARKP